MADINSKDNSNIDILVVEDDENLSKLVNYNLTEAGYSVRTAFDGEEALLCIKEKHPDLIILDWMLPKVSGIEVCRQIKKSKKTKNIPIILATAKAEDEDVVTGINLGADDYLSKPFSIALLLLRVKTLLHGFGVHNNTDILKLGVVKINVLAHKVTINDNNVKLGPTEYKMLLFLMKNPNRVFSREQLLDAVWGENIYVEARTVDVHIRRLRKALNKKSDKKIDMIRTVRSAGYSIEAVE